MNDRQRGAVLTTSNLDVGIKLLSQSIDDASTETGRNCGVTARPATPLSAIPSVQSGSLRLVGDIDPTVFSVLRKCMLEGIKHTIGDNEADADGVGR